MRSVFSWALAFVLAFLPNGYAQAEASPAEVILTSKHLVQIADGRRVNFVCAGSGSPTVVFEGGLGAHLLTWQKVVGPVTRTNRACFYDRAGYGYSDPPRGPSTAGYATNDLHEVLRRAHVRLPMILVAHSVGGLYATLYADRYPTDVAGLVLIDPSFAGQDKDESADELAKDAASFRDNVSQLRACARLAQSGKLRSEKHDECFMFAPERTPQEKAFLTYQMVRPARYETMASEAENQHSADGGSDVNSREETSAKRSFGNMPVIVLTAAIVPDANAPAPERALAERNWRSWKAGHDALAARSVRGQSLVVQNTGHFIQTDQPSAVLSAINEVVQVTRRKP